MQAKGNQSIIHKGNEMSKKKHSQSHLIEFKSTERKCHMEFDELYDILFIASMPHINTDDEKKATTKCYISIESQLN